MSFSPASGGQIGIDLVVNDLTRAGLQTAEANLAAFEGRASSLLYRLAGMSAAAGGIVAIGAAFGVAARSAAQVEQNVANLNAALRATPQQLQAIRTVGLQLSQVTQFTDAQILQGQRSLAKAGTTPQQLASQPFNANITDLASATFAQPVQAADAYIAATKTFRRGVSDAKETVDILAQAVDSSVGNLGDFQAAFKQIGPVANSAGESLRDTATAIADLQNAGLRGDTGTAIKTLLTRIEAPTRQAKAEIDALGLSFYTTGGQLKDFASIADEIRLKTVGLTDEQRNSALTKVFGTRGVRVADVFAEEGGQGIRDTAQHMTDIGSASDIAKEKLDTLEGSAHKLSSSINVLGVQMGQGLVPTLRAGTDAATGLANVLSTINQHSGNLGTQGVVGGLAIAGEVLIGRQLGKLAQSRSETAAAPGIAQKAADDAAQQAYVDREAARYQRELDSYEQYQSRLAEYQARELERRAANDAEIEALEKAHFDRLFTIQQEGYARAYGTPGRTSGSGKEAMQATLAETEAAAAAEKEAFNQKVAGMVYAPGKAPVAIDRPVPIALPIEADPILDESKAVATFRSKAAGWMSAIGKRLGEIALPLTIAVTAWDLIVTPIDKAINASGVKDDYAKSVGGMSTSGTTGVQTQQAYQRDISDANQYLAEKKKQLKDLQEYQDSWKGWVAGAKSKNSPSSQQITAYQQDIAQKQDDLKRLNQAQSGDPGTVLNTQVTRMQELIQAISDGSETADQASKDFMAVAVSGGAYSETIVSLRDYLAQFGVSQKNANDLIDQFARASKEAADARRNQLIMEAELSRVQGEQAAQLKQLGVPDVAIQQGVYKTGTPEEVAASEAVIRDYQERDKAATDFWNKENQRVQQAHQAYDSLLESTQQSAGGIVGKIDLSKGIDSLVQAAPELQKVRAELTALGASDPHLDALAKLADQFKSIADAEDGATRSLSAYLLTVSQSDKYIGQLDTLQKTLAAAVDEAYRAQGMGTANADQQKLIANAPGYFAQLRGQNAGLQADQAGQVNNLFAGGVPDYIALNRQFQQGLAQAGGANELTVSVHANTTAITDALDAIALKKYTITLVANIEPGPGTVGYGRAITTGGQSPYDETPPYVPNTGGLSGGVQGRAMGGQENGRYSIVGDSLSGKTGVEELVDWTNHRVYPNSHPMTQMALNGGGIPRYAGGTMTPRGDASALVPLDDLIESAASAYGVPSWLIGAVIMHESGGTIGRVEQGGGAGRGLMQVDGGYHQEAYDPRMTGTSMNDAAYQINIGTRILKEVLGANPNNLAGVQNYAGSAYRSQAGGGVPAGLDLPTELSDYYRSPVTNAIGGAGKNPVAASVNAAVADYAKQFVGQTSDVLNIDHINPGVKQSWNNFCEGFVGDLFATLGDTARKRYGSALEDYQQNLDKMQQGADAPAGAVVFPTAGANHVGVSVGGGRYISTDDAQGGGIHYGNLGPNSAYYIDPTAGNIKAPGYGPGTYSSTGGTSGMPTDPGRSLWDATGAVQVLVTTLNGLRADQIKDFSSGLDTFVQTTTKMRTADATQANGGVAPGPNQQFEIGKQAMKDGAQFGVIWATTLRDISSGAGLTATSMRDILATAGPLGPLFVDEAKAMAEIETHAQAVEVIQQSIKNLEADQAATQRQRAQDDRTRQRSQQDQQFADQKSDATRQRSQTLEQRGWQDQDRRWQQQQRQIQVTAQQKDHDDQVASQAENDRYLTIQRHEEDVQRQASYNGGLAKQGLIDQAKILDDQHRQTTQGMSASASLFVNTGKASTTEAGALANASQAAAINDARRKADDLYKQQKDDNQRLQDQADKDQSKLLYDLETERISEQRKHEDAIKGIATEADKRHWSDQQTLTGIQNSIDAEATRRLTIQRGWEDDQFNIQQDRLQRQINWDLDSRRIEDERTQQDEITRLKLEGYQSDLADEQNAAKAAQDQLGFVQNMVPLFAQMYDYAGKSANVFLSAWTDLTGNPKGAKVAATPLPGNATGTRSFKGGWTTMNELGGELAFLPGGSAIVPADQTRRIIDIATRGAVAAPAQQQVVVHQGDVHISIDGADMNLTDDERAAIRSILANAAQRGTPRTVASAAQSSGSIRRAI